MWMEPDYPAMEPTALGMSEISKGAFNGHRVYDLEVSLMVARIRRRFDQGSGLGDQEGLPPLGQDVQ